MLFGCDQVSGRWPLSTCALSQSDEQSQQTVLVSMRPLPQILELYASGACGNTFRRRIEITHPTLRLCMGLKPDEEMHHDVQASQSRDPITLEKVFTISQVSVLPLIRFSTPHP